MDTLAERCILVVGDLILDEYLIGRATRLSREAPVPVLEFEERFTRPGGAANPAHNVVALGGEALAVGVVGDDEPGRALRVQLADLGIDTAGVVLDPDRLTTVKTRIVARGTLRFPQHLARLDRVDRRPVRGEVVEALSAYIQALLPDVDAVLISDYRSGVVTPEITARVLAAARKHGTLIAVDSQGNLDKFHGFDLVKCNRAEAAAQVGFALSSDADFEKAAMELLSRLRARMFAITRGPEGMTFVERGSVPVHLPAANRSEVFDVTGAGDTVIAVLTQALVSGLDLPTAAGLANVAAGLVVQRFGNAVVTPEELAAAWESS
ncbi:MAG TPA: ribokinase [Anaerolineae bacterium]|nr:ribokinase [Anaerolineae bacterium]